MDDTTERNTHTETYGPAPTKLVVDLIGPYAVHFVNGMARVHAPFCQDHHANILTDSNDIALSGLTPPQSMVACQSSGFVYRFKDHTGPIGHPGTSATYCPEKLLLLNKAMDPVESDACNLTFDLPNPDIIVPLIPEQIFIHRNGACAWFEQQSDIINGPYARGVRFIYSNCPVQPQIELQPQARTLDAGSAKLLEESLGDFNPVALGFDPPLYQFSMRFASNSAAPDDHHEDAYNCFQMIRSIVLDTIVWRADFDDTVTAQGINKPRLTFELLNHSGTRPVDCGASVLAIQS